MLFCCNNGPYIYFLENKVLKHEHQLNYNPSAMPRKICYIIMLACTHHHARKATNAHKKREIDCLDGWMDPLHFVNKREKKFSTKICSFTLYLCCCNRLSCVHIVHRGETLVIIILTAAVVVDVAKYKKSLPSVHSAEFFLLLLSQLLLWQCDKSV